MPKRPRCHSDTDGQPDDENSEAHPWRAALLLPDAAHEACTSIARHVFGGIFPEAAKHGAEEHGQHKEKSDERDQGARSTSNDPPKHRANKGNDRQIRRRAE